jgi:hypothetical protein
LVLLILVLLVILGITPLLAALIRRSVPREVLRTNNEAAVTYLTVIGVMYQRVLETSEKAYIARRTRLLDAEAALGSLLWTLVIVGGLATIVPTLFIHVEHRGFLVVAKTCMITLLVLTVYTIYDLQRPFRWSWPVEPRPYILIQERMQQVLREQGCRLTH